jgi:hypothetical protein
VLHIDAAREGQVGVVTIARTGCVDSLDVRMALVVVDVEASDGLVPDQ